MGDSYILVLGASVVDIVGFCGSKYCMCDSTPGTVKMSFGGVCRNMADNMARVGVNTKFISILGNDEMGRSILEHSKCIGYDMEDSLVIENGSTPTYMAILNEKGEMVSAVADMKSIGAITPEFIDSKAEIIENAEYVLLDSDNPVILEYILTKFRGKTKFFIDPVSACKAKGIKPLLKYFHAVKPNRYEAEVLCDRHIKDNDDLVYCSEYLHSLGIEDVFISLDEEGVYYSTPEGRGRVKTTGINVSNVTGGGDSLVAGIAHGYQNKLHISESIKFAIAMSAITIEHEDTIHPKMNLDYVNERLEKIEWIEETI